MPGCSAVTSHSLTLYLCCLPGFGGAHCQRCEPGTWSDGGSLQPCRPCGPGLTSQAGAPSVAYCGCFPGFGRDPVDAASCSACPAGTWSSGPPASVASGPAPSVLPCTQCAPGRTGPQGATSPSHCYCAPGTWAGTIAVSVTLTWFRKNLNTPLKANDTNDDLYASQYTS